LDNTITKDGVYKTKNDSIVRQILYGKKGQHIFSETGYSDLFGKHGSFKEYEQMCKLSCYGLSPHAIADVLIKAPPEPLPSGNGVSARKPIFFMILSVYR
jgi:hypothetical protein